jgi:ABC transport system ATP-binding/permease protein
VLDEPTNDLDLETLDVLEEMLGAYAGTVILISHDRDFLDRIVNLVLAPEGDGRWIEYAGGYSDMLAQRGADLASRKPQKAKTAPAATAASAAAAAPAKRRLSFNEQHALKTLPTEIATLQLRIRGLQERLGDPALYARDRKAFTEATTALAAAQAELVTAEETWLQLEMLREAIEGG